MVNYSQSKIYKITNTKLNKCYIGATTQSLQRRFLQHKNKSNLKSCTSYILFLNQNLSDITLEVLEEANCKDKEELGILERKWIKNSTCINKQIPLRDGKEWYNDNKEMCALKSRLYHYKNRDKICEKKKIRYQEIKADILKPMYCECGVKTSLQHYTRHIKTKRHNDNMEKLFKDCS